jgi:hypothetical protein
MEKNANNGGLACTLLGTPQHIIDERSINVRTSWTNRIKERFIVLDEILVVRELLGHDLVIAAIAEHHEPPHDGHGLPACAASHLVYTDPFCRAIQKSSGSRSMPHSTHSYTFSPDGN